MEENDDLSWSFQREVRANQMNTNNLLFLKVNMEINFLKFILYRKLYRIYMAKDICSDEQLEFDLNLINELQDQIPGILIKLAEWIGFLKTIPIKPRDDFFEDIMEIHKDLKDQNKGEITIAYEHILKVTEEYKQIIKGV